MMYVIRQVFTLAPPILLISTLALISSIALAVAVWMGRPVSRRTVRLCRVALIGGALLSPAAICQSYWGARLEFSTNQSNSFAVAIALLCALWHFAWMGLCVFSLVLADRTASNEPAAYCARQGPGDRRPH